jgi:hypothetical protein
LRASAIGFQEPHQHQQISAPHIERQNPRTYPDPRAKKVSSNVDIKAVLGNSLAGFHQCWAVADTRQE